MAALSNYLENALMEEIFNGHAFTPPATYVSLYTDSPGDDDSGTEVSGGAYERKLVNVAGGSAPAWNDAAVDGTSYLVDNAGVITFPTATASWGTVSHFGIHDAASTGNLLFHGALTASKAVGDGDTFTFPVGDLNLKLD